MNQRKGWKSRVGSKCLAADQEEPLQKKQKSAMHMRKEREVSNQLRRQSSHELKNGFIQKMLACIVSDTFNIMNDFDLDVSEHISNDSLLSFRSAEAYEFYFERLFFADFVANLNTSFHDHFTTLEGLKLSSNYSCIQNDGVFQISCFTNQINGYDLDSQSMALAHFRMEDLEDTKCVLEESRILVFVDSVRAVSSSSSSEMSGIRITLTAPKDDRTKKLFSFLSQIQDSATLRKINATISRVGSTVPVLRQYYALKNVHNILLAPFILEPQKSNPDLTSSDWNHVPEVLVSFFKRSYNESQFQAIRAAISQVRGFRLIQGPPGTGKTKTLIGILNCFHLSRFQQHYQVMNSHLLQMFSKEANGAAGTLDNPRNIHLVSRKPKILVCAPSNAAVDEIVDRLFEVGLIDGDMKRYNPDMVRIGYSQRIRSSVKALLSLDSQAAEFFRYSKVDLKHRIREHSGKLKQVEQVLDYYQKKAAGIRIHSQFSPQETAAALEDVALKFSGAMEDWHRISLEISRCKCVLQSSKEEAMDWIKRSYLNQAQIIFSTMNGSANSLLENLNSDFDLCLIDESAQCVEVSTLIPLQLNILNCVLVGDPRQLPATVFSTGQSAVQYEKSLFQRFQEAGHPVTLLETQYRMHPEISAFSSAFFYESRLKDGDNVKSSLYRRPFHENSRFRPFQVFDVPSMEEKMGHSLYNLEEAEFLSSFLFDFLSKHPDDFMDIGIITPYKEQKKTILKCIQRIFPVEALQSVEVDTVDSFQGREKQIILFSCVRAESSGIGFLSDIRRMNVGITRAKYALWIFGDVDTLVQCSPWKSLVDFAREKNCLYATEKESIEFG